MTQRDERKDAAYTYAMEGLPVLALHSIADTGCTCGRPECTNPGKHPRADLIPHGVYSATKDIDVIADWQPPFNVGGALGTVANGVMVFDVDNPDIAERLYHTTSTLPQETGVALSGRGCHVWFRVLDGQTKGFGVRDADGNYIGSVQGDGQYVVMPPSKHASGKRYRWLRGAPFPDLIVTHDARALVRAILKSVGVEMGEAVVPLADAPADALSGLIEPIDLPDELRNSGRLVPLIQILTGTVNLTHQKDRSGKLYSIAADVAEVAKDLKLHLTTRELAGVVKHADQVAFHKYTHLSDDREYLRIAYKVMPQDIGEPEELRFENGAGTATDEAQPPEDADDGSDDGLGSIAVQNAPSASGPPAVYFWDARDGITYYNVGNRSYRVCNFKPEVLTDIEVGEMDSIKRSLRVRMTLGDGTFTEFILRDRDLRSSQLLEAAVSRACSTKYIIYAGQGKHLRPAMYELSRDVARRRAPNSTGWFDLGDQKVYLLPSAEGAIGPNGVEVSIKLDFDELDEGHPASVKSMMPYGVGVRPPYDAAERALAWQAFEALVNVGLPEKTMPIALYVLAGALASAGLGESPPVLHVIGRTGSFKTAYTKCAISLFGRFTRDASAPISWSSTANAINKFLTLKDITLLVDDYKVALMDAKSATKVVQNYADRGGRSRLNAESSVRAQNNAQGLMLSTGEEIWEDEESGAARTVRINFDREAVERDRLKLAQIAVADGSMALFGGWWLRWLAAQADVLNGVYVTERAAYWINTLSERISSESHARIAASLSLFFVTADVLRRFITDEMPEHLDQIRVWLNESGRALIGSAKMYSEEVILLSPFNQLQSAVREALASKAACLLPRMGFSEETPRLPTGVDPRVPVIGYYEEDKLYLTKRLTYQWYMHQQRSVGDSAHFAWSGFQDEAVKAHGGERFERVRMYTSGQRRKTASGERLVSDEHDSQQLSGVIVPFADFLGDDTK